MLCLYLPGSVSGQNIVMANDAINVFYESLDNPVSIAVENTGNIIAETDNGTLLRSSPGKYILQNAKPGMAVITLKQKAGKQLIKIGEKKFRVKELPLPRANIGGRYGGSIVLTVFKAQMGLRVNFDNYDFDISLKITRFNVTIIRNGESVFKQLNTGNNFSDIVKEAFQKTKVGDVVMFDEIFCLFPSKSERKLVPIEIMLN